MKIKPALDITNNIDEEKNVPQTVGSFVSSMINLTKIKL